MQIGNRYKSRLLNEVVKVVRINKFMNRVHLEIENTESITFGMSLSLFEEEISLGYYKQINENWD